MLPFLHARQHKLNAALAEATEVWRRYHQRDLGVDAALEVWLQRTAAVLKELSLPGAENECAALQGQWAAAREGIDPLRREVATTPRRTLRRIVALHVLASLCERLRQLSAQADAGLMQGRAQLLPIVAAALEAGLVDQRSDGGPDQQRLETLWRRMQAAPALAGATRQVALSLALPDVLLLIEDLLAAARA